jgi:hypothetical protein
MNVEVRDFIRRCSWIPAFAGMTGRGPLSFLDQSNRLGVARPGEA